MSEIASPQAVPAELKQALIELLQGLGDDEFILGYWDSEWTGVAPMLEEDVAMSSIAQDEIGHARLFYQQIIALTGGSIDQLAYGRQPEQYRQVQLVERHRGDWAFTIARQFLYDTADQVRLASLQGSAYIPLAQDIAKIEREEVYHQMHVHVWLERLANSTPEARQRLEQALEDLWPDALGMFEPFPHEETLLKADILTVPSAQLQQEWLTAIAPIFQRWQLPFPIAEKEIRIAEVDAALAGMPGDRGARERQEKEEQGEGKESAEGAAAVEPIEIVENLEDVLYQPTIAARTGGRVGRHTQDFRDLWEQMTMVYRMEPQAQW